MSKENCFGEIPLSPLFSDSDQTRQKLNLRYAQIRSQRHARDSKIGPNIGERMLDSDVPERIADGMVSQAEDLAVGALTIPGTLLARIKKDA